MAIESFKLGENVIITGPSYNPKIPSIYQIEAFSRCNLKCPFCLTGIHKEPLDYIENTMEMSLFEKIVERDLQGSEFIELQMRGEPTLNKNLHSMVTMLREKVLVGFSTHGNTLHIERNMLAALDSHLITISIDSGTEEIYNQKRIGGNWKQLLWNIDTLMERKGNRRYPIVDLQLLEIGENWEKDFENLKILANSHGWKANIRSLHNTCLTWENPKTLVINNELCMNPWLSVSIKCNGDVVACCMAFEDDPKMTYGNLNNSSLEEIWNGELVKEFRYKHLLNTANLSGLCKELPEACKQCYSRSPALLHDKILKDALKWNQLNSN